MPIRKALTARKTRHYTANKPRHFFLEGTTLVGTLDTGVGTPIEVQATCSISYTTTGTTSIKQEELRSQRMAHGEQGTMHVCKSLIQL